MPKPSPRQRLADLLLHRPVIDFIAEHKANGDSFHTIARRLCDATDGEIDVTPEAVRQWYTASQSAEDVA